MKIDANLIKETLLESIDEYRTKANATPSDYVRSALDNVVVVLAHLLQVIKDAEKQQIPAEELMQTIKNKLVAGIVSINDIELRRRSSELEANLTATIEALEPGQAAIMANITYNHLHTKLSQMRERKMVPENIHVARRGEKVYLVKKAD